MRLPAIFKKILRCKSGTSSIEYGMILAVFVLLMLVALQGLADETTGMWSEVSSKSSQAMNGN